MVLPVKEVAMSAIKASALFTFSYMLGGHCAAEFECRASAAVMPGRPARLHPPPGDPGEGPGIEDFDSIEVDVGHYDFTRPAGQRRIEVWAEPDDHLRALILEHLESGAEDDRFIEAAEECRGPDPDAGYERRRDEAMERI
jgi:hypothetical protein